MNRKNETPSLATVILIEVLSNNDDERNYWIYLAE